MPQNFEDNPAKVECLTVILSKTIQLFVKVDHRYDKGQMLYLVLCENAVCIGFCVI